MPKNTFDQIWQLIFLEIITFFRFVTKWQTKPFSWLDVWTRGKILTYLKKKFVQIRHVWTVTDNKNLLKFENGSHFWTPLTLPIVDRFGQTFFLNWSEFYHESINLFSWKVWFVIWSQIKKRWLSQKKSAVRFGHTYFWALLRVPNNM